MEAVPRAGVLKRLVGSAADLHARELPHAAAVWEFDVDRPALVLGSAQRTDLLDLDACRRTGVDVVRRRSGGGLVLLVPGAVVWLDVYVPAGDRRWYDDVRRSMVWMGEAWVAALHDIVTGELTVHRGPSRRTAWSDLVCFAGIAPGEVLLDGLKLVGISQRRTRHGARFQCAVHRRFDPDMLRELLGAPPPDPLPAVATVPAEPATIGERLLAVI